MKRRARGFSLTEILVSVAIVGLAMGGLYDVLVQGMTSVARTRSAETSPQLDAAWLQVRRDVQAAVAASTGGESWNEGPLELALPGGGTIRLALRGVALVREESAEAREGEPRLRVLARPVRAFRWRRPAAGLVEVELTPARAFDAGTKAPMPPRASSVLAALRGAGRSGGGW